MQLQPLDAGNRAAFEDLLCQPWQQNLWTDPDLGKAVVQWRYFDRPDPAVTWLAMDNDRCVATFDSMLRPYLLNKQRILVRETADWYCMPDYRSGGIGLRLLLKVMSYPEPVFTLGGSEINGSILSRLRGWTTVPTAATNFVFALKARDLAASWMRRKWGPESLLRWVQESVVHAIPGCIPIQRPRRIKPPSGRRARLKLLDPTDSVSVPLPGSNGLIQLFEQQHWTWLNRMPAKLARPCGVQFFLDDVLVGFACVQIEPTPTGLDGKIVYLQAEEPLLPWVTFEITQILADQDVGFIRCLASNAAKAAAMKQVGYLPIQPIPGYWRQQSSAIPSSIDVGYFLGDFAIPFRALRRSRKWPKRPA